MHICIIVCRQQRSRLLDYTYIVLRWLTALLLKARSSASTQTLFVLGAWGIDI